MRLDARLARLSARARPAAAPVDAGGAYAKLCARLERYAPLPAGASYPTPYARLDAVLDRLHATGVGIAAGPNTPRARRIAAAFGWTVPEYRAALHARARGETW